LEIPVTVNTNGDSVLELHNSLLGDLRTSGRLKVPIGGARPLVERDTKVFTADSPTRSLVIGSRGEPVAVLFVSNSVDVAYVARNVEKAAEAKRMLGDDLGSVILEPLAQGDFRSFSFALWPWHRRMTSVRGLAYLQRRLLLPHMLAWLREVTERTVHDTYSDELGTAFTQHLKQMAQDHRFPLPSQDLSQQGLERLESGSWRPRVVLQHKDFCHWNILLPRDRSHRRQFPRGFILIDWAGANLRGYPFFNLLLLAQYSRMPASVLRAELLSHCRILSCETCDVMPYLLAALGFIGTHLGHFAESDYVSMFRKTIQFSLPAVRSLD